MKTCKEFCSLVPEKTNSPSLAHQFPLLVSLEGSGFLKMSDKRGEVAEMKALISNPAFFRDLAKRRDIIKKVIGYMTQGLDMSKLFSDMVMAASTKDLVQKKMIYHYLCGYAQQKSDLALLAINTLLKDCKDDDPLIRGLALRSLCSLRLHALGEYVLQPLRAALVDQHPYVRRTAAICVAKLNMFLPHLVRGSDLVDGLHQMLRDRDAGVVGSVLNALYEISDGQLQIQQQMILYLLNRLRDLNEWCQCLTLNLTARYKPANDDEMFDIMVSSRLLPPHALICIICVEPSGRASETCKQRSCPRCNSCLLGVY